MQRRTFCAAMVTGTVSALTVGCMGLISGCGDTSLDSPPPSAEQVEKAKDAQKGMLEFLKKKGGTPKKH